MTLRGSGLLLAIASMLAGLGAPAAFAANPPALIQLLPQPAAVPPPAPVPLAPPINPGYAAAPPNGLSPLLTQPGPLYQLPAPASPTYPRLPLPGPVDQQKMQAYRNSLLARQWQLQRQGVSPGSEASREIQQQLSAPDPQ